MPASDLGATTGRRGGYRGRCRGLVTRCVASPGFRAMTCNTQGNPLALTPSGRPASRACRGSRSAVTPCRELGRALLAAQADLVIASSLRQLRGSGSFSVSTPVGSGQVGAGARVPT